MKKTPLLLAMILILTIPVFADEFKFKFDGIETNPEILFNFFPTYIRLGVSYDGIELIEGNTTEIIFIGSGGYGHVNLWTDANGIPIDPDSVDIEDNAFIDQQSYNNILLGGELRLKQFLNPLIPVRRGDLSVYGEYGLAWMHPLENGDGSIGLEASERVYPDRDGVLWNTVFVGIILEAIEKAAAPDGYQVEIKAAFAPLFLGNTFLGTTSFTRLEASVFYYRTLIEKTQKNGRNLFALYLADHALANVVLGEAVPQRVQKPVSLGDHVRGFEDNSFGTLFTAVNNFEVRLAGPEIFAKNIYPRMHVFFDVGTYAGEYHNTGYPESGVIASAGFEVLLTVLNLVHVGYRGSIPLKGRNMAGSAYVGKLKASLQF